MRKLLVGSALVAAIGIGSLGVAALNPVGAVERGRHRRTPSRPTRPAR